MSVQLIAYSAAAIALFAAGYKLGGDSVENDWQREKIVQQQAAMDANHAARMREQELTSKLQEAQNAAKQRETTLRADADRARSAVAWLRNDLAAIRNGLSSATTETCAITANAAIDVFGQCTEEYRAMAEVADRHANDAKMIHEAWPE